MILEGYRKKRDFKKTPEPQGKSGESGEKPVFLVHKHNARRLHYDLRLEAGGVLKSWAVPKGISTDPLQRRLAMKVEDHPLEYQHFEGIIPAGNYGAGEVIIWDKGTYHALNTSGRKENEKSILSGIEKGKISFILEGKKLKGEFALVRIKKAEDSSWLIIKKKDDFSDLQLTEDSVKSGKKIEELIAMNPDKKKESEFSSTRLEGWGAKRISMPDFVPLMLAKVAEKPFAGAEWMFEIKWDGYRALAHIQKGKARLFSRNKKRFSKFELIEKELVKMGIEAILDGEVVSLDRKGLASFQNLQNFLSFGRGTIVYYVFDVLYLNGYDLRNLPLFRRREILEKILPSSRTIRRVDFIAKEGIQFFEAARKKGLEGVIAKQSDSLYESGRRSEKWLKIKISNSQEVVVGGFTEPRGSRKYIGSLVTGVYEDGKLRFAGHLSVGSGEKKLLDLRQKLDPFITKKSPFETVPKTNEKVYWVEPKIVVEARFTEWTENGSMRHPVFVGIREDKNAQEVLFETFVRAGISPKNVIYSFDKNSKETIISDGISQQISNSRKIFWPEEKITKGEVINYYRSIAGYIMPYLNERPQVLKRYPDGIQGEYFYQKNIETAPTWMETIKVPSEGEGRVVEYLVCNKEADLVYMANLGCIEIHPWLSNRRHLDFPDFAVIDLDPLEIGFEAVVETALGIQKLMHKLRIGSFVKTSGATGMHIYFFVDGRYNFSQVVEFVKLLVMLVHREMMDLTSIERLPEKRKGKVYLDYLQNRKGQTLAAPYSLRAFEGAPVSAPLEWKEVNRKLDPLAFNIETIGKRLEKKGDVWKEIFKKKTDIEKTLKGIEKLRLK